MSDTVMRTPEDVRERLKEKYGVVITSTDFEWIKSIMKPEDCNSPKSVQLTTGCAFYKVYHCTNRRPPRPQPDGTKLEITKPEDVEYFYEIGDTYLNPIF